MFFDIEKFQQLLKTFEVTDQCETEQLLQQFQQASSGDTEAMVYIALWHKEYDMYQCMSVLLKQAAQLGDANAKYELANCYFEGQGVEANEQHALELYEQAAKQGHADATNNLADMYLNGEGTEVNEELAFKWFTRAAELGVVEAMFTLGIMYEQGVGVVANNAEAFSYYWKAANGGYDDAQYRIGTIYFEGLLDQQQDYEVALKWYERAAETFHLDAIYNMAYCYEHGFGVVQNVEQAIIYYKQAALLGDYQAKINLSNLYEQINPQKAVKWLEAAKKQEEAEFD